MVTAMYPFRVRVFRLCYRCVGGVTEPSPTAPAVARWVA